MNPHDSISIYTNKVTVAEFLLWVNPICKRSWVQIPVQPLTFWIFEDVPSVLLWWKCTTFRGRDSREWHTGVKRGMVVGKLSSLQWGSRRAKTTTSSSPMSTNDHFDAKQRYTQYLISRPPFAAALSCQSDVAHVISELCNALGLLEQRLCAKHVYMANLYITMTTVIRAIQLVQYTRKAYHLGSQSAWWHPARFRTSKKVRKGLHLVGI